MHFGIIKNKLRCFKCNSIATIPGSCPNCGNVKLISSGIGTQKIKNKLTELFPNTKLSIIEENNNLSKEIYNNSDIIVATKKIINSGFYFDFTALINIDGMFNFPDYNTNENIIFDLANLLAITKKEMLIQTFYPDNFILQNLKYPKIIYKKILEERKKYLYPPYAKIIKLIFKNKDEKICQKETEKLLKSLSNINYKNKFEIIGFGPSFIDKKRDLYFYQIIIKYLPQKETQVKKLLSLENQLGKWIIDVDPVNLI